MKEIVENDPLIQKLFLRKQLTPNTKRSYITALTDYCTLNQMTPSQLRQEAYQEQITIIDTLERQIETRLLNFYNHLNNKNLKNSTILHRLNTIRAFYTEYKIDLPRNIELTRTFDKEEKDHIKIEHIRQVVNNTSNIKHKAIITLMASSGIRQIDIINFKIKDFMQATQRYHDETNPWDMIQKLEKKEVIPIWKFKPQKTIRKGNKAITCSSPESTQYILTYLKTRDNLYENNPLFLSAYGEQYSKLSDIFQNLSKANAFGMNSLGENFFHGHGLRDFFATTLNESSVQYPVYKKMMGHSLSNVDRSYVHIGEEIILAEYKKAVNKLSINEVKVHDFKSEEYLKLEKKFEETDKKYEEMAEYFKGSKRAYDLLFQDPEKFAEWSREKKRLDEIESKKLNK